MNMTTGQLFDDNHNIIQCDKVRIKTIIKNDREKRVLVPITHELKNNIKTLSPLEQINSDDKHINQMKRK